MPLELFRYFRSEAVTAYVGGRTALVVGYREIARSDARPLRQSDLATQLGLESGVVLARGEHLRFRLGVSYSLFQLSNALGSAAGEATAQAIEGGVGDTAGGSSAERKLRTMRKSAPTSKDPTGWIHTLNLLAGIGYAW